GAGPPPPARDGSPRRVPGTGAGAAGPGGARPPRRRPRPGPDGAGAGRHRAGQHRQDPGAGRGRDGAARARRRAAPGRAFPERGAMGNWLRTLWYEVCRGHIMAGLTLGFSLRWEGGRNIPRRGPALLIANHESFLDPIAVGLTTTRQLCYLARKTLFTPGFGWFLRSVNCVPVDQEGVAKEGLKTILKLLR